MSKTYSTRPAQLSLFGGPEYTHRKASRTELEERAKLRRLRDDIQARINKRGVLERARLAEAYTDFRM
jgi:hypothetical protein